MTLLLIIMSLIILLPIIISRIIKLTKSQFKKLLVVNLVSFFGIIVYSFVFMITRVYGAQAELVTSQERGMAFLAAALVTGMCTIGTGIATGQAASAALGAISENEGLMGKALIFVALAEGIAIYGLLISFTILARV